MTSENVDDYFSISDILTTQERLPCKVEVPIHRLGKLCWMGIPVWYMVVRS